MERRVLLAISLSFLVLFGYQALFVPPPPPPGNETPGAAVGAGVPGSAQPASAPATVVPPAPIPPSETVVGETAERTITVETQLVQAVFSNQGGRLLHWTLKNFHNERGEPLDLIPEAVPAGLATPFALSTDDPADFAKLNSSWYRVTHDRGSETNVVGNTTIDATSAPVTLSFDLEAADGLKVSKQFTIEPASYIVTFSANVQQGGQAVNPKLAWGPGLGDEIARTIPGSFLSPNYTYTAQAIYHKDGDVTRVAYASLTPGQAIDGPFRWAGVDDQYFISAILQPQGAVRLEFTPHAIPSGNNPAVTGHYVSYTARFESAPSGVKIFFGPKQFDVLRSIDPEFTKSIYFGMFAWLAAPLLDALRWAHGYVGNWGWSIIVLTILINLAMFPLRHKSVVSMRRMQELQPQLKAIQDRYAKYKITDPERQKMNTEVMDLYRAKGVNPASGCLPMLLTMPFLFAFYSMLSQAIEIRGADFGGWITDLSLHDPLYITPVLMGLTMFWQQKITPSTADPTQQKVMMIMPFMFTFMFLWAPSGLVIYWFVSNLFAIGQQYFTNWYLAGKTAAVVKK